MAAQGAGPLELLEAASSTLDDAFDAAEAALARGARRVSISLWTPENGAWGLADSATAGDPRGFVVGRDRWRQNAESAASRLGLPVHTPAEPAP